MLISFTARAYSKQTKLGRALHTGRSLLNSTIKHSSSRNNEGEILHRPGLNKIDISAAPFLASSAIKCLKNDELSERARKGSAKVMNMYTAINDALRIAMDTDESAILFGEDVAFGGVFRCSMELQERYGGHRVFNTPLCEQGIVGFGVGYAAQGGTAIAEIQFSDYVFPAFDQIVNEAAKYRYRGASIFHCGGLTVRMPSGAIGHGALYHSQSNESYFAHCPGLKVVMPRSPLQAKGLLLASIRDKNPVIFLECKALYRGSTEYVPQEDYELPLGKAEIVQSGNDVTLVGYGTQMYGISKAAAVANDVLGVNCEIIDLRTIAPWDQETVIGSVNKTGRCIIVHEDQLSCSVASEIAATVQQKCFLRLESPIQRVTGWDTHIPLQFEKFMIPDVVRIFDAIKRTVEY